MHEPHEVLRIAAEHGVTCDIEMLEMKIPDEKYVRMVRSDLRYRFVIDMETIKG
ncbi:MAG: hypothetical protein JJ916_14980 [Phycisphaerales bacterium]|nr:hypothetical protein [Phycisphaerales bacterium]